MKEINFLPDWYIQNLAGRRQRREYFIVIILIIVDLIAWNLFVNEKAAFAKAGNDYYTKAYQTQSKGAIKYDLAQAAHAQLKSKAAILDSLDSKVNISTILAELTYLTGDKIILNSLEIKAEPVEEKSSKMDDQIRVAAENLQKTINLKGKQFKVILLGIAAGPADVAQFINNLEQSNYFRQIKPGFSRNSEINGRQVSEFEISCCLANYNINK